MDCDVDSRIDLHIHSSASDGTLTPAQILSLAADLRLAAIAITDHDTVDGCRSVLRAGLPSSPAFITGVEISAAPPDDFPIRGSLHILGYGFRIDDRALMDLLERLASARADRNPKILDRLRRLGIRLTMADLCNGNVPESVCLGRPHIAAALVQMGHANSIDDAFHRYIGNGAPAYVDKYRVPCEQAINMIRRAGGAPVLAHPALIEGLDPDRLPALVERMISMGLSGLEVLYPDHDAAATARFSKLASDSGLLMTGGSDFHGAINPKIQMGVGYGDLMVPVALYHRLLDVLTPAGYPMTELMTPFTPDGTDPTDDRSGESRPEPEPPLPIGALQDRLSHRFQDLTLLENALNHSSYVNEQPRDDLHDNERLEFLGDAVINLVVGHLLMTRFPELEEGVLSRLRANLVNETELARLARVFDLGAFIRLGRGEALSGGREKQSILADAFEAVVAAIYLDAGFAAAFAFLQDQLAGTFAGVSAPEPAIDHKSRLQETAQGALGLTPVYRLAGESGPDHDKTFHAVVRIADMEEAGVGKSKKAAEQDAARNALDRLTERVSARLSKDRTIG